MKHIQSINEYRFQLEIPFDNKHPLHGKPAHVHLLDALKQIDTKKDPDDYYSTEDIEELWKENEKGARIMYDRDTDGNGYPYPVKDKFIRLFPISRFPEYYHVDETDDIDEDNIDSHLTDEGEKALDSVYSEYFDEVVDELGGKWQMIKNQDENGLIHIYRAITLYKNGWNDEFERIIKKYNGVGVYWSWCEDGAEPHSGGVSDKTFTIYGKVKPEYVDWESTIYKSAYDLKDEKEVEVKYDAEVLIYGIGKYGTSKFIELDPPIIVPV